MIPKFQEIYNTLCCATDRVDLAKQDLTVKIRMTHEFLQALLDENPALTFDRDSYHRSNYLFGYPIRFVSKDKLNGGYEIEIKIRGGNHD